MLESSFSKLAVIVQFLLERNLAFRGSVERIGKPCKGNFVGLVKLLAKCDPVIGEYL